MNAALLGRAAPAPKENRFAHKRWFGNRPLPGLSCYQLSQFNQQPIKRTPMDLHHPITGEFPRHLETIKQLKNTSAPFRKSFNEYHRLDDAIFRVEEDID